MFIFGGNIPDDGYKVQRSLRFNPADSAYLTRTPAVVGNRKTWTWSSWVKRSSVSSANAQSIFSSGSDSNNYFHLGFNANDTLYLINYAAASLTLNLATTQVFRDPSAWYHIVVAVDTTQATSSERVKVYVNGSRITSFTSTTYPTQNADLYISLSAGHTIASLQLSTPGNNVFSGYLTEIHFIDGASVGPEQFGEIDADTGVWKPKRYTGSYGINGFHLPFSDNSSTTNLGKDFSGVGYLTNPTDDYCNFTLDSATTISDSKGVVGNATITGTGLSVSTGIKGNAITTSGTSSYFTLPLVTALNKPTTFTISYWTYITSTGLGNSNSNVVMSSTNNNAFDIFFKQNGMVAEGGTNQNACHQITPWTTILNTWVHTAVVRTASDIKVYINGKLRSARGSAPTAYDSNTTSFFRRALLGADANFTTDYFRGFVDDIRIWTRGLSDSEINAVYASYGQSSLFLGSNPWTPTNLSVTAGPNNDSLIDTPTPYADGGNNRGNYCTLNPISTFTTATLTNGNLEYSTTTVGHNAIATFGMTSGKWYWEAQTSAGTTEARATVCNSAGTASTYYSFAANATVYGFRFDAGAGTLDYTTNGTTWTSLATGLTSGPYFAFFNNNGTTSKTISTNFGQRPFQYSPPSGYKALNTFNLP